ncbi:MAG: hypothetical protein A4E28_00005 [Methanocella sp. PtaU1.Bin125]|nr:MAG: hypothetical protein A4E28_00005 [Methanocella sp. PtaU1.Bin125]
MSLKQHLEKFREQLRPVKAVVKLCLFMELTPQERSMIVDMNMRAAENGVLKTVKEGLRYDHD